MIRPVGFTALFFENHALGESSCHGAICSNDPINFTDPLGLATDYVILPPEGTQDSAEQKGIAYWIQEKQRRGDNPDVPVVLIHASSVSEARQEIAEEQKKGPKADIRRLSFHGHMAHGSSDAKTPGPTFIMGEVEKADKWRILKGLRDTNRRKVSVEELAAAKAGWEYFQAQHAKGFFEGLRFDMSSDPEVMFLGCSGSGADITEWKEWSGGQINTWLDTRLLTAVADQTRVKVTASTHTTYGSKEPRSGIISFGSVGLWVTYDPKQAKPNDPLAAYSLSFGNRFRPPKGGVSSVSLYLHHAGPTGGTLPMVRDPKKIPPSPYGY